MTITAYLELRPGPRFTARVLTAAGALIGQAVDADSDKAAKRACRQAYRWAEDRGWPRLTIKHRKPARQVNP